MVPKFKGEMDQIRELKYIFFPCTNCHKKKEEQGSWYSFVQ